MSSPGIPALADALRLSLERAQGDLGEALALLKDARCERPTYDAQYLLARTIDRLERMRDALGRRDGPILP